MLGTQKAVGRDNRRELLGPRPGHQSQSQTVLQEWPGSCWVGDGKNPSMAPGPGGFANKPSTLSE